LSRSPGFLGKRVGALAPLSATRDRPNLTFLWLQNHRMIDVWINHISAKPSS